MEKFKIPAVFAAIILASSFILSKAGFTQPQIISTAIFLIVICGTLFYWRFRLTFAFVGIAALLAANLLDIHHIIEYAGLDIILFLVGMMCVIGHLEEKHFFEYIIAKVVDKIGHHAYLLMAVLMLFSTVSAALV